MERVNKYLLLIVSCAVLFTACKVLEATWEIPKAIVGVPAAIGESLGIIEGEEETQEKVINGKVVTVNSKGEVISPSSADKGPKINIGYLIWWAAVLVLIVLTLRHFLTKRHE